MTSSVLDRIGNRLPDKFPDKLFEVISSNMRKASDNFEKLIDIDQLKSTNTDRSFRQRA